MELEFAKIWGEEKLPVEFESWTWKLAFPIGLIVSNKIEYETPAHKLVCEAPKRKLLMDWALNPRNKKQLKITNNMYFFNPK